MIERFSFARSDPERQRLDALADLLAFTALGNTQRGMLRNLAEPGEPLDLIVRGLLAYADEARYHASMLDLQAEGNLEKALRLNQERKYIDWTISLLERLLTPLPTTAHSEETKS